MIKTMSLNYSYFLIIKRKKKSIPTISSSNYFKCFVKNNRHLHRLNENEREKMRSS